MNNKKKINPNGVAISWKLNILVPLTRLTNSMVSIGRGMSVENSIAHTRLNKTSN